jgi:hypothetical protein
MLRSQILSSLELALGLAVFGSVWILHLSIKLYRHRQRYRGLVSPLDLILKLITNNEETF